MKDILNRSVPIKYNNNLILGAEDIAEYAINKEEVIEYIKKNAINIFDGIQNEILKESPRFINLGFSFKNTFNEKDKRNVLIFDVDSLIYSIFKSLDCKGNTINKDEIIRKCEQFGNITTEQKLQKKFPSMYEPYLEEIKINKFLKEKLYEFGNDIKRLKLSFRKENMDQEIAKKYAEDSLKITNVKHFCRIYSEILKNILLNYDEIDEYLKKFPIDVLEKFEYRENDFEADFVYAHLKQVNRENDLSQKQKHIYFLSSYFNENKNKLNKNIKYNIDNNEITYDDLYNMYIEALIENPGLRTTIYNREDFNNFTYQEIEEYLEEANKTNKANWDFLESTTNEERAGQAIYNGIKNIESEEEKVRKKEELKKLYIRKRDLFDQTENYKIVEGKNTFDGYIAYIYPNGKVIMEKFFERRKNNEEVIAKNNAIYVMDINDFYSLTSLSKQEIIDGDLCKRIIHNGKWEDKVINEIKSEGHSPVKVYKKLEKENKIIK